MALTLRQDYNPKAPAEVWVGVGPRITYWGNRLATPGLAIPVYVKPDGNSRSFKFLGRHRVVKPNLNTIQLEAALDKARADVRHDLSRLVYLSPA